MKLLFVIDILCWGAQSEVKITTSNKSRLSKPCGDDSDSHI